MIKLIQKIRQREGMASLEVLIGLTAWFFALILFINVMFMLAGLTTAQGNLNRGTQIVGALGCMPTSVKNSIIDGVGPLNQQSATVRAIAANPVNPSSSASPAKTAWIRSTYLNNNGDIRASGDFRELTSSCNYRRSVPSGTFIFVQLKYTQPVPVLALMGFDDAGITVTRNAMVTSQSLQIN
jgi:hypothetical protein